ncbi:pyridoxal phosphate-dependent aminotransferase [Jiella pacifica]|uniref:Aminotransferase n=1 Tax=Jiella pacifica TaxID=2696469 RepID=A0A6N9T280_9HYPH|nr:pyridoxal phosphate-dependent aminotransferase [Jiella pacifica]NDW04136.1 aminotransferase class I/II-fold pyridoxal phosphate-dependent enzyme [Jiella pacifica]
MLDLTRLRREAVEAPESGIVAVVNHARGKEGIIPMWAGEGDLATPQFIADAAAESLKAGETFYTWQRGLPELREALSQYTSRLYGQNLEPNRFFVTGSGMHAIQIALMALAGAGDEVVFIGPTWPNFAAAAGLMGAATREVSLDSENGSWSLDLDKLKTAITEKTRVLFVNSPSNPTGWTASRETLSGILKIAREAGIVIIADEIYARFYYEGQRAPSFHDVMASHDAIIFVNSFSKNWAMTGWRIGWIEASPALGQVVENLIQYSNSGVAAFMQRGAIAALKRGEEFVENQVARAETARDIFGDILTATNKVELSPPDGAFYAFFKIDGITDTKTAAFRIVDEAKVAIAPGTAFGPQGKPFFRACFHRRLDEVEAAAHRLAEWIGYQV